MNSLAFQADDGIVEKLRRQLRQTQVTNYISLCSFG
jgi:hypothetical protein